MSLDLEFITKEDKPALLGFSNSDHEAGITAALIDLGYKVHAAHTYEEFVSRFGQIQYQLVVIEELFAATCPEENLSLRDLQEMPMNSRRHSVVFLIGESFQTLSPFQAFQQSVHAVINPTDIGLLSQLILKVNADNDVFLNSYRETLDRVAETGYSS